MSRIIKFFKALRNNPKKTVFFSAVGIYGTKFGKDKYQEEQLMASYCREAALYGEERHHLSATHRHITVLLNPAAAGGKCKAQFEKYCAPLLHLAGLKVAIVRTEHQGQARDLMAVMEKTDCVVVAGGDGTLSEVLTGLLRRDDNAAARLPLAVLPLGSSSVTGRAVWGLTDHPQAKDLLEATMAVVRQVLSPMDVMEVTPHSLDGQAPAKPIYASMLEWGAYKDAWERRDKYWYYATLKGYVTYLFSSYKDLSWDCSSTVEYTVPCSGCSTCRTAATQDTAATEGPAKRWYQYLLPSIRPSQQPQQEGLLPPLPKVDYSSVSNPKCGVVHRAVLGKVCDVRVSSHYTPTTRHLLPHQLLLQAGTPDTIAKEFIREGWRRNRTGEAACDTEIAVGSITITPTASCKNNEGEDREFYLDGESYEVRPVTIRARPRAVTIFSPAPPS